LITSRHIRLFAKAIEGLLGQPAKGSVAFLRCRPSETVEALAGNDAFQVPGVKVFGVTDRRDAGRRLVTADRAVEFREDKDDPILLLIDTQRAGAGLDGIYSAGREFGERELFAKAIELARKELQRGHGGSSRAAVTVARRIGQRNLITPWQEFDFLVATAESPGPAVTRLGLWPILCEGAPDKAAIELSRALVNRLLIDRSIGLTPQAKVAALMLDDATGGQAVELERFLREAADIDAHAAVVKLLDYQSQWVGALKPRFTSEELQKIEWASWKRSESQVHKWSGLRLDAGETTPRLILDRNAADSREGPRLEVRWNTKPAQLPKGAVEYQIAVMSGDESLATRTVPHKPKGPQKTVFTLEDFEELDETARFEAFVRVSAVGRDDVQAADGEEFILEFGVHEGTVSSTAGSKVRSIVEGAVIIDSRENFDAAIKDLHLRAHEDKKGYIAWRSPSGRSFRVLRPSLIREAEQHWIAQGGPIGRWSVVVRADGSRAETIVFHHIDRGDCPEDLWDRLWKASNRMCGEAGKGSGLLALVHGPRIQWVDDYLLAWAAALEQGDPELALAHTVEVRTVSGRTLGLIVLPAHPLRLAWHAAYDQLAAHARYEEGMTAANVMAALKSLDSALFPAVLPGLEPGQGFVFGDTLGFHAVAMVGDRDPEPKAAISLMATCLAGDKEETAPEVGRHSVEILAREVGHYLDCHTRADGQGQGAGPDLLQVHAIKPGDGMIVGRALGRALASRPARAEEETEEEERDLCFILDLFPSEGQEAIAGRFLLDVARRRRAGAGTIDQEDRWILETVQRPGDIAVPRLRWARREGGAAHTFAHVAFAFDIFASRLEAVAADALPRESRPLHGYGLMVVMERRVTFGDDPTWWVFLPPKAEGDKHPANRTLTDRLARLHEAVARVTALRLGGDRSSWPVLTTRLPPESQDWIRNLHRTSDWVVTADRNVCVEYFDSPKEARAVYDAYVIDCVPERNDLGCLQLVTSTCNLDEVRNLFDEMLGEMGLSSSARNCEFLLGHLKGLSGRLAIRLASEATKAGELVALAIVHAACARSEANSPVWLALANGFFIPLDELGDIIPLADRETGESRRADLVFVAAPPRRPLEFRFVEVKFRRHLRTARSGELLEMMVAQTAAVRKRWEDHFFFFGEKSPVTRALRRSALARLLYFYVDKARRHHLSPEAHERLRREIDKLLLQGDGYTRGEPERPDYGYVFCPELRTVEYERLYAPASETANLFLVGISDLPDGGGRAAMPSTTEDSAAEPSQGSGRDDGEASVLPATDGSSEGAMAATDAVGPVDILLGRNATTDERVHWRLSIKSNPHLMIVGLPGMGKTTCLVNLCRQLHGAGITPVVFSYHQDIDEKLEAACGQLGTVDYDGLGFNPLQVALTSPHAHVDVASELRDIFGAIFPDLGDIQTEEIRQAIKQSYTDLGWGGGEEGPNHAPVPPFQAFFDILRVKPKPNPGLMARLTELSDYGFFKTSGKTRSLLDIGRPSVLRIHRTANELLQRGFASFVLYSIYKDMFKRGPQTALTHAVVFDEAHRASRLKLLPTMAKECRKFGIALVLASQEARDFDPSLFSNIASYLALRVTEREAKTIAKIQCSSDVEKRVADRLKQLTKYTALFFSEGSNRPVTVALAGECGPATA